jgi:HSP20 family protein
LSELDRRLSGLFGGLGPTRAGLGSARPVPRFSSRSEAQAFVLEAEVPGLAAEDLAVTVHDGILRVAAELGEEQGDGTAPRRWSAGFERRFRIPRDVDASGIEARLERGVLELRLPREEAVKPWVVEIQAA